MTPKHRNRRLGVVAIAGVILAGAAALALMAISDSASFFRTPSDLLADAEGRTQSIRLGGLVEGGSVRTVGAVETVFRITDGTESIEVAYTGPLPDLFREGQGVIATGDLGPDGRFEARRLLAKHDENYVPKELVDALGEDMARGEPAAAY
ncbi:MAG: cytochrome c maturation protein CcmE [Pseudomonadota bacterium]